MAKPKVKQSNSFCKPEFNLTTGHHKGRKAQTRRWHGSAQALQAMLLSEAASARQRKEGRWFSGHLLPDGHIGYGAEAVEGVGALVAEVDGTALDLQAWAAAVAHRCAAVAYESWSSPPGPESKPGRYRIIIAIKSKLAIAEAQALLAEIGHRAELATESGDSWRLWWMPRTRPDAHRSPNVIVLEGAALDPESLPWGGCVAELVKAQEAAQEAARAKAAQEAAIEARQRAQTRTAAPIAELDERARRRVSKMVQGMCDDIRSDLAKGGRCKRIYSRGMRLGRHIAAGFLEADALCDLEQAVQSACALAPDLNPRRALESLHNGYRKGLDERLEERELGKLRGGAPTTKRPQRARAEKPPTPPELNQVKGVGAVSLEEGRAQIRTAGAAMFEEGNGAFLAGPPGLGKTTTARALHKGAKGLRFIVRHTRDAILEDARAIPRAIAVLGRKREGAPKGRAQFGENLTGYTTCTNAEVLRRGEAGEGVDGLCKACPLRAACVTQDGQAGMMERAEAAITNSDGIIVCCFDHLLYFLKLAHAKGVAPASIWLDDVSAPQPKVVDRAVLQNSANLLQQHEQASAILRALESAQRQPGAQGEHGHHWRGDDALGLLRASGVDADALAQELSSANRIGNAGAPLALRDVLAALKGERFLSIIATRAEATLHIYPARPQIPDSTAVIVASSTGERRLWEAFLGRRLPEKRPLVEPKHSRALWFESLGGALNVVYVTRDHERALDTMRRLGEQSREHIAQLRLDVGSRELRGLVVWHKQVLDAGPLVAPLLSAFQRGAGLAEGELKPIYWRGVECVGSNDFQEYDLCITLGDPLQNMGAWGDLAAAAAWWASNGELEGELMERWRDDAEGLAEQAHGRLRWTMRGPTLHIAAGAHPGPMVRYLAKPQELARPSTSARKLATWPAISIQGMRHLGLNWRPEAKAAAAALPHKNTIAEHYEADTRPEFIITGRYAKSIVSNAWKADTADAALTAAQRIARLCGGEPGSMLLKAAPASEEGFSGPPVGGSALEKFSTGQEPDPVPDGLKNGQKVLYRSRERALTTMDAPPNGIGLVQGEEAAQSSAQLETTPPNGRPGEAPKNLSVLETSPAHPVLKTECQATECQALESHPRRAPNHLDLGQELARAAALFALLEGGDAEDHLDTFRTRYAIILDKLYSNAWGERGPHREAEALRRTLAPLGLDRGSGGPQWLH
jgi:hypothetical protein